jgi:hypothetical protein
VINDFIAVTAVNSAVVMARVISKVFNNGEFVVEDWIIAAAFVILRPRLLVPTAN